jgi:hypothetical protein
MIEQPPDIEPDIGITHERLPQPDPYAPTHQDEGLYDEPTSGYYRGEDPYRSLGGLARPNAYFGAIEFDCPTCEAAKDSKCLVWVERLGRNAVRHMPCLARIKLATEAGRI